MSLLTHLRDHGDAKPKRQRTRQDEAVAPAEPVTHAENLDATHGDCTCTQSSVCTRHRQDNRYTRHAWHRHLRGGVNLVGVHVYEYTSTRVYATAAACICCCSLANKGCRQSGSAIAVTRGVAPAANKKLVAPPSTQSGMLSTRPPNLPSSPNRISQADAAQPAQRDATPVKEMTPLFCGTSNSSIGANGAGRDVRECVCHATASGGCG